MKKAKYLFKRTSSGNLCFEQRVRPIPIHINVSHVVHKLSYLSHCDSTIISHTDTVKNLQYNSSAVGVVFE